MLHTCPLSLQRNSYPVRVPSRRRPVACPSLSTTSNSNSNSNRTRRVPQCTVRVWPGRLRGSVKEFFLLDRPRRLARLKRIALIIRIIWAINSTSMQRTKSSNLTNTRWLQWQLTRQRECSHRETLSSAKRRPQHSISTRNKAARACSQEEVRARRKRLSMWPQLRKEAARFITRLFPVALIAKKQRTFSALVVSSRLSRRARRRLPIRRS